MAALFDLAFANASNEEEDDLFAASVQEEADLREGSQIRGFSSSTACHDEIFADDESSNKAETAAASASISFSSSRRAKNEKRASKATGATNQSSLFG